MRRSVSLQDVIFDAIDGEAFTDKQGHHYALLVASCFDTGWKQTWNSLLVGRKQLPTWAVLRALTELGHTHNRIHVAFYFNYDVTKWVEDLTIEEKTNLWHNGETMYVSPQGKPYRLEYLPNKLFRIITYDNSNRQFSVTIYDVFGFFQKSFVKTLQAWGLTEEIEFIEKMKTGRKSFRMEEMEEIERYSLMETDLLCQLMNRVRDALLAENIPLTKWFGSGSIAEALLNKYEMGQHISIPKMRDDVDFQDACMYAYFGGRFELFKQGVFKESHNYDINSAYPAAMAQLPSFRDCTIRAVERYNSEAPYSLWYVQYNVGTEFPIGPLPYRTETGSILFPYKNEFGVWVHQVELQEAMALYGNRHFKILFGYIIRPKSLQSRYSFIPKLAARRLQLKRDGDQRNIVLKLGMNALYGKTAQAISTRGKIPPFQNFYVAGYITAATRAKLLRFSFDCGYRGRNVIQFATDGVFSTRPNSLQGTVSSEKLGEWEYKKIDRPALYLKPGIYFTQKEGKEDERKTTRKTRGFAAERFTAHEVFNEWNRNGPYGMLSAADTRFIGIGSCLVKNDWSDYGKFITVPLDIKFGPGPTKWYKYGHGDAFGLGETGNPERGPNYYLLEPNPEHIDDISRPYTLHYRDKIATLDSYDEITRESIREEILSDEQPDFDEYLSIRTGTGED